LLGAIAVSTLLQVGVIFLPPLSRVFLGPSANVILEWAWVLTLSLLPVTLVEVAKILRSKLPPSR
jgi:hypothetical protein